MGCPIAIDLVAEVVGDVRTHVALLLLCDLDEAIGVEISDNGKGSAKRRGGSGLQGLADHLEALGGQFHLRSPAFEGTIIQADIPLN